MKRITKKWNVGLFTLYSMISIALIFGGLFSSCHTNEEITPFSANSISFKINTEELIDIQTDEDARHLSDSIPSDAHDNLRFYIYNSGNNQLEHFQSWDREEESWPDTLEIKGLENGEYVWSFITGNSTVLYSTTLLPYPTYRSAGTLVMDDENEIVEVVMKRISSRLATVFVGYEHILPEYNSIIVRSGHDKKVRFWDYKSPEAQEKIYQTDPLTDIGYALYENDSWRNASRLIFPIESSINYVSVYGFEENGNLLKEHLIELDEPLLLQPNKSYTLQIDIGRIFSNEVLDSDVAIFQWENEDWVEVDPIRL